MVSDSTAPHAFALYDMKIVLGTLLQRYRLERIDKNPIKAVQRDFLIPGAPLRMVASPDLDVLTRT